VRPDLVEAVPLDKQGCVSLTADALGALLGLLQQHRLADALGLEPGTPQDTAAEQVLAAVGLGTDAGAGSSSSSSGDGVKPYYNFTPIDTGVPDQESGRLVGVSAADAELNSLLGDMADKVTPAQYQAKGTAVLKAHIKGLGKAAKAAQRAGRAADAGALHFLAAVLRTQLSGAVGQVAVHDLLTQVLVLLGGEGTGTRGHLDPAAALTFAYALLQARQQEQPDEPVADWLFISPAVFRQLHMLRKLLWTLQDIQLDRAVKSAKQALEAPEAAKAAAGKQGKGSRKSKAQLAAAAALEQAEADRRAFATRLKQQEAREEQRQRQRQQRRLRRRASVDPAAAAAAAGGAAEAPAGSEEDCLTAEEQRWLTSLLLFSSLDSDEMLWVHLELGPKYSLMLSQGPGQGVSVPVGWMHWVVNLRPCIKVAWEVVRPQHMAGAGLMQRLLRSRALGLAPDYLALVPTAARQLRRCRQFL
jgi:hypothetical protein